jgi:hypothetical protein
MREEIARIAKVGSFHRIKQNRASTPARDAIQNSKTVTVKDVPIQTVKDVPILDKKPRVLGTPGLPGAPDCQN